MPLSEIRSGMIGKVETVFSGTKIEAFGFEVLSVEKDWSPNWDVIWIRGKGDNFDRTGGASGMSGSPCYIDGKLIGALSLVQWDQRENANIAGITPIELMLSVTERGMSPNLSYRGTKLPNFRSTATRKVREELPIEKENSEEEISLEFPKFSSEENFDSNSAILQTPIAFSAIGPEMLRFVKPMLDKYHMVPVQSSGGGTSEITHSPIEAGQIVGVEYARGDFTAFGYGTITYVDEKGSQLIGFGHAMSNEGNINLPISGGYVHYVLPRRTRSVKIASPTQPIGTMVQDRQGAIAGIVGTHPSFIPVTAKIRTADGVLNERKYEVVRHRGLSAIVTMIGIWNMVNALEIASGDYTIAVDSTIKIGGNPELSEDEIHNKNVYSSTGSPGITAARSLMPLMEVLGNSYADVKVKSVDVELTIASVRNTAELEGIRVHKEIYRPGDLLDVMVQLRPHMEDPRIEKVSLRIPEETPSGELVLIVASADSHRSLKRLLAPLNYHPTNVNQLIEILQQKEKNNDLILELVTLRPGMTIQGEEFPELPFSVLSVMDSELRSSDDGYTRGRILHIDRVSTDYVISGSRFLRISIDGSNR